MKAPQLHTALSGHLDHAAQGWLTSAVSAVHDDPGAIRTLFASVARHVGRAPILASQAEDPAPWTADDAARALLLVALGSHADEEVVDLYRYGDADEQRAIVRSLHLTAVSDAEGRRLLLDATRTNDPRMIRVALGPYGLGHLDDEELAQVTLKAVFMGVSLRCIDGLPTRATPRMAHMLAGFAVERVAAGRSVPPDIWPFVDRHPPEDLLAAIAADTEHPVPDRRAAAQAALAQRAAGQPTEQT